MQNISLFQGHTLGIHSISQNTTILHLDEFENSSQKTTNDSFWTQVSQDDGKSPYDTNISNVDMIRVVLLGLVMTVGSIGNTLTFLTILLVKKLHSCPQYFIANLAVVDFIACSVLAPQYIYRTLIRDDDAGCPIFGFLGVLCFTTSMVNLAAIAVNRLVFICYSTLYCQIYKHKVMMPLSILAVWAFPGFISLVPFLGLGRYEYNIALDLCLFDASSESYHFSLIIHFVLAFPSVTICAYCYMRLLRHLRQSRVRIAAWTNNQADLQQNGTLSMATTLAVETVNMDESVQTDNVSARHFSISAQVANNQTSKRQMRANAYNKIVVKNFFLVWVLFMLFWMPVLIPVTIDISYKISIQYYSLTSALALGNSAVNFFIYAFMNRRFKKALCIIISCQFRKLNANLM